MPDRLGCCVPFCRRTRKMEPDDTDDIEWICGKHWPLIPRSLRQRDRKLVRMYRRRHGKNPFWHYKGGTPERISALRIAKLCATSWDRCKKAAIEAAAGI